MPFSIVRREMLAANTFLWEVDAPEIARACGPGQFVMVRLHPRGERIPLTIADKGAGTITLVVKVIGKTTMEMASLKQGSTFSDLVGPLGNPTQIEPLAHVVLVGGGIGVAPIYPILQAFREAGSRVTVVLGFKTVQEIFWRGRFAERADSLHLTTDDGSEGRRGTVIDPLKEIIVTSPVDRVIAIGPLVMMEAVAETTRPWEIPTVASMNPIMVDGIGMCGSCRVRVGDRVLFSCVDGPDMDAHRVDFAELKRRLQQFRREEEGVLNRYREECRHG